MATTDPQKLREKEKRKRERQKARDPEGYREKQRARRRRATERLKESDPEGYRKKQRDKESRKAERLKESNPEKYRKKLREKQRRHRERHPEIHAARKMVYRFLNPEKGVLQTQLRRARKAKVGGKLSRDIKAVLMEKQRGKCACCGTDVKETAQLDHIVPLALGGPHIDSNIQLLCPFCNGSKHARHPIDFMQSRGFLL